MAGVAADRSVRSDNGNRIEWRDTPESETWADGAGEQPKGEQRIHRTPRRTALSAYDGSVTGSSGGPRRP
jgi:hypothetical protein